MHATLRFAALASTLALLSIGAAADSSNARPSNTQIAAGTYHTCALGTAGGVRCWGYNFFGQLGDNTTTSRLIPADVAGLTSGVAAIAVGAYHSCALTFAGAVKCWGKNSSGQLGDNSITDRHFPVDVSGLASGVAAISAGLFCITSSTCGVGSLNYTGLTKIAPDNASPKRDREFSLELAARRAG